MPFDLTPPANLADLLQNPQRVKDAFALLIMLQQMRVQVMPTSASVNNQIIIGSGSTILPIPLAFETPIANSVATADSCSTQLNLLFSALRRNKQLPQ